MFLGVPNISRKLFRDVKYAITSALSAVQSEVSTNTLAISNLQSQLIVVGIDAIVSGAFNFIDNIVSSAVLSAQIATCFKLGGSRTFTSNITSANDTYTFFETFSSKYIYISNVTSDVQIQKKS